MKMTKLSVYLVCVMFLVLASVSVNATTWYVNSTHPSCSNAYDTTQTQSASTPYCTVNTAIDAITSPGLIIVQGIHNDTSSFNFDSSNSGQEWRGVGINHAKLQGFNQDVFVTGDNDWTNVTSSFSGRPVFLLNSGILTHTSTSLSMHYSNGTGILKCQSQSELTDNTVLGGCYWWNSTGSDLYVSRPVYATSFDANAISWKISKGTLVDINGADDFNITGFTLDGGTEVVYITGTGTDNVTVKQNFIDSGKSDKGAITLATPGTKMRIINNTIHGRRPLLANWDDQKNTGDDGNEYSCLWGQKGEWGAEILYNNCTQAFNGIYLEGNITNNLGFTNATIMYNTIYDTYDDSIELELYADGWVVANNKLDLAYVGFSISPFYSKDRTYIVNNTIISDRRINETPTVTSRAPGFKAVGYTCAGIPDCGNRSVHNLTIEYNTIISGGTCFNSRTSSTQVYWNAWVNTSIRNNICYVNASGSHPLDANGLYSSNNARDFNLYWRLDGSASVARFYDGGSSSSVNITQMRAQQAAWDQNSLWENPNFVNVDSGNYTPSGNACTASSSGGSLGDPRWACATDDGTPEPSPIPSRLGGLYILGVMS